MTLVLLDVQNYFILHTYLLVCFEQVLRISALKMTFYGYYLILEYSRSPGMILPIFEALDVSRLFGGTNVKSFLDVTVREMSDCPVLTSLFTGDLMTGTAVIIYRWFDDRNQYSDRGVWKCSVSWYIVKLFFSIRISNIAVIPRRSDSLNSLHFVSVAGILLWTYCFLCANSEKYLVRCHYFAWV